MQTRPFNSAIIIWLSILISLDVFVRHQEKVLMVRTTSNLIFTFSWLNCFVRITSFDCVYQPHWLHKDCCWILLFKYINISNFSFIAININGNTRAGTSSSVKTCQHAPSSNCNQHQWEYLGGCRVGHGEGGVGVGQTEDKIGEGFYLKGLKKNFLQHLWPQKYTHAF